MWNILLIFIMKRLIVCCDGTWNRADQAHDGEPCPTNVVKMASRVAKRDGDIPQVVYYGQGVGSGNILDRYTGGAFGHGLEDNIYEAYRFLMGNYEDGDEIFLFGFSRGAFTARSLGGMIRNCGILKRESTGHYQEALDLYQNKEIRPKDPESVAFRKQHSVCGADDIRIKFIGVWDTVGSLGIPLRGLRWLTRGEYQFHDTELSKTVEHACHALAIDERRKPFKPTLWKRKPKAGQTVEQVWFAGAHTDIGGGYPDSGLSDITLEWMIGKAKGAGLAFDAAVLDALPLSPDPLGKLHNSRKGFYRLSRGIDRTVGASEKQSQDLAPKDELLHGSVIRRWDGNPGYRPVSLAAYFDALPASGGSGL
ncbi:MAG: DUF2235 domain-containing protein [Balneolales bacterium]